MVFLWFARCRMGFRLMWLPTHDWLLLHESATSGVTQNFDATSHPPFVPPLSHASSLQSSGADAVVIREDLGTVWMPVKM